MWPSNQDVRRNQEAGGRVAVVRALLDNGFATRFFWSPRRERATPARVAFSKPGGKPISLGKAPGGKDTLVVVVPPAHNLTGLDAYRTVHPGRRLRVFPLSPCVPVFRDPGLSRHKPASER